MIDRHVNLHVRLSAQDLYVLILTSGISADQRCSMLVLKCYCDECQVWLYIKLRGKFNQRMPNTVESVGPHKQFCPNAMKQVKSADILPEGRGWHCH